MPSLEPVQERHHAPGLVLAHPRHRLVQEKQARLRGEHERQLELTLLAMAEDAGGLRLAMAELDPVERERCRGGNPVLAVGRMQEAHRAAAPALRREPDIPGDAELGKDVGLLVASGDAEAGDAMRRPSGDVVRTEADAAGIGRQVAREQVDERRLAGAVRADDAMDLARRQLEIDTVDGDEAAEAPRQSLDPEGRLKHPPAPAPAGVRQ